MRSSLASLTLTIALIVPAGVASASTVSLDGTTMDYQAGPKASDVITNLELQLKELLQPVTVGAGCVAGPPISCPGAQSARFEFGNKSDAFRGFSFATYTVNGNGGADSLRTAGGTNIVSGGDGRDRIWENGNFPGTVHGDDGDDKIFSFEHASEVHGDADDDLLVTSAGGNVITGDTGNDVIAPLSGFGSASGGSGADTIVTPAGGSRSWTINGGAGADTIRAIAGSDTVTGGDGNDVIDVSGDSGTPDSVSCGNGRYDTVYADADDVIDADCETVSDSAPTLTAVDDARAAAAAFRATMPDIPAF